MALANHRRGDHHGRPRLGRRRARPTLGKFTMHSRRLPPRNSASHYCAGRPRSKARPSGARQATPPRRSAVRIRTAARRLTRRKRCPPTHSHHALKPNTRSIALATPFKNALLIALLIALAAALSYRATISHGISAGPKPTVVAALVALMATIPPLYFTRLLSNGATNQLAVVAWRMAIMLPALAIAVRYTADERKCYLISLLACYFISLPLESWLLIRDVRRYQDTHTRGNGSRAS